MKNKIWAIPEAVPAMPPNPKMAAMIAITRNVRAQVNIVIVLKEFAVPTLQLQWSSIRFGPGCYVQCCVRLMTAVTSFWSATESGRHDSAIIRALGIYQINTSGGSRCYYAAFHNLAPADLIKPKSSYLFQSISYFPFSCTSVRDLFVSIWARALELQHWLQSCCYHCVTGIRRYYRPCQQCPTSKTINGFH